MVLRRRRGDGVPPGDQRWSSDFGAAMVSYLETRRDGPPPTSELRWRVFERVGERAFRRISARTAARTLQRILSYLGHRWPLSRPETPPVSLTYPASPQCFVIAAGPSPNWAEDRCLVVRRLPRNNALRTSRRALTNLGHRRPPILLVRRKQCECRIGTFCVTSLRRSGGGSTDASKREPKGVERVGS
jgi:hypothetical protein